MFSATQHRRARLVGYVQDFVHQMELSPPQNDQVSQLVALLHEWLEIRDEKSDRCTLLFDHMAPLFKSVLSLSTGTHSKLHDMVQKIWSERDMFPKLSQWICGGDGWAYDIGFGGLDHIEAFEANDVNVLVVDTEMYSNTGGQQSKATPAGAAVKFAMGGKQQKKKSLGEMFMTYEHVYVASVALNNSAQVLQAFWEADQHQGPSIIVAYAPCIQQGVRPAGLNDMYDESKFAVESGYWPLYRYNPELTKQGQNPFVLDSKKLRKDVTAFLQRESRFINLRKRDPKVADSLWEQVTADVNHRMEHLQQLAEGYKNFSHPSAAKIKVLFASETGTAARVARDFANACPDSATASALDDIDLEDDINGKTVVLFVSTCGQGAMPRNGRNFYHEICQRTEPLQADTKFLIFGLGDSSYYFYLKAARDIEDRLIALGATQLLGMGEGDDAAEEGMEVGLHNWLELVWPTLEIPPPSEVPHIQSVNATFSNRAILRPEEDWHMLELYYHGVHHAVNATIVSNDLMCRPDYNRDFRKLRLAKASTELEHFQLGDALEIFPQNDPTLVSHFLHNYSPDFGESTVVQLHQAFGIHGEISLAALFTSILDLFGKPTKHFLHELATFAKTEQDKKTLLDPLYLKKAAQQNGVTVADVLMEFHTANPPLPALLGMIPQIKPRAYSIASAPHANQIELLILIDTWWCEAGMKYGLTCNMLRKLHSSDTVWCRIHPGSMEPPSPQDPVVCAGIGSGLAPHMAFLRDRVRAAEAGEQVGPFALYFGNRYRAGEYLYESELTEYARKYSEWFHLHVAFSRDDPHKKVYVQDLVGDTDEARLYLRDQPGLLYVCGNRQLPKPLQQALVKSFCRPNSEDESEVSKATKAVEDLYLHGKAQQEVW
jgi:sulfite reductase alpha subunit-like flavoprotein